MWHLCMSCIPIMFLKAKCVYNNFSQVNSVGFSWKIRCMMRLSSLSLVCHQNRTADQIPLLSHNLRKFCDFKFSQLLIPNVFILPPCSTMMREPQAYSRALDMLLFCQRKQVVLECLYRWEDWLKRFPHLRHA